MADRVLELRSGTKMRKVNLENRALKLEDLVESYSRLYTGGEAKADSGLVKTARAQCQDTQSTQETIQVTLTFTESPLLSSSPNHPDDDDDDAVTVVSSMLDRQTEQAESTSTTREILTDALTFAGEFVLFFGKKIVGIPVRFDDTEVVNNEEHEYRIGYSRVHRVEKQDLKIWREPSDANNKKIECEEQGEDDGWTLVETEM